MEKQQKSVSLNGFIQTTLFAEMYFVCQEDLHRE